MSFKDYLDCPYTLDQNHDRSVTYLCRMHSRSTWCAVVDTAKRDYSGNESYGIRDYGKIYWASSLAVLVYLGLSGYPK